MEIDDMVLRNTKSEDVMKRYILNRTRDFSYHAVGVLDEIAKNPNITGDIAEEIILKVSEFAWGRQDDTKWAEKIFKSLAQNKNIGASPISVCVLAEQRTLDVTDAILNNEALAASEDVEMLKMIKTGGNEDLSGWATAKLAHIGYEEQTPSSPSIKKRKYPEVPEQIPTNGIIHN